MAEMQRARALSAAIGVVDELGWSGAVGTSICARARLSRRTFYELFDNRDGCLLAMLEGIVETVRDELAHANVDALSWRERVRMGLWTILSFFEREPVLARVCLVQALRGGPRVLEYRERILAELAGVVDGGRFEAPRGRECPSLTAEGLVGAGFSIVSSRLLRGEHDPLTSLFGELMGMIVLPYLGPAATRREQARPAPTTAKTGSCSVTTAAGGEGEDHCGGSDPLADVPMRLTYRTALVLEAIAQHAGVSNRLVGDLAGISDQGQISKLLTRLERLGLIENTGNGHLKGEANAWSLTPTGQSVTQGIRTSTSAAHNENKRQLQEAT